MDIKEVFEQHIEVVEYIGFGVVVDTSFEFLEVETFGAFVVDNIGGIVGVDIVEVDNVEGGTVGVDIVVVNVDKDLEVEFVVVAFEKKLEVGN
jgi:hypothetical protein